MNSDINRLYTPRNKGGRGMNSLVDIFILRMLPISHHLKVVAAVNPYTNGVVQHEEDVLIRLAEQLATSFDITTNETEGPEDLSMKIKGK